jgi:hypothetical protein
MLDHLVNRKINAITFKYDKNKQMFLDHVAEKWVEKIPRNKTYTETYEKYRTWSIYRLNDYVEVLLKNNAVAESIDIKPQSAKVKDSIETGKRFKLRYQNLVDSLKVPDPIKFSNIRARLPIGLSDSDIMQALVEFKNKTGDTKFVLDIDYAKAILSTIIITYSQYKLSLRKMTYEPRYREKKGYVQCSWNLLRHTCSNGYPKYLKALQDAGIVECDGVYANWGDNKKAYSYKINDRYFETTGSQKYRFDDYNNYHIRYTQLLYKMEYRRKQRETKNEFHTQMIEDVETLIAPIDTVQMAKDFESNKYAFYNVKTEEELEAKLKKSETLTIEDFVTSVEHIQTNGAYFNVSDDFGGRFHSPFTNLKSVIRNHVQYNDMKYINIDISNSQMIVLSTIMDNPKLAKRLLTNVKFGDQDSDKLINAVELINGLEDVKNFCEKAKTGEIYETVAEHLGTDRQQAKINLLSILFSNEDQFKRIKTKMQELYPSLIKLSNQLNCVNGIHYLPMLCQRFESELFINTIVKEFFKHKKYPAITIHDSIMVHPEDYEKFMLVYKNEFSKLGLTSFQVKVEQY